MRLLVLNIFIFLATCHTKAEIPQEVGSNRNGKSILFINIWLIFYIKSISIDFFTFLMIVFSLFSLVQVFNFTQKLLIWLLFFNDFSSSSKMIHVLAKVQQGKIDFPLSWQYSMFRNQKKQQIFSCLGPSQEMVHVSHLLNARIRVELSVETVQLGNNYRSI